MPITSAKVLRKMSEIQSKGGPTIGHWHQLRHWLLMDEQIREDDAPIICPGCGEVKIEEKLYCTNCGTNLPSR